jgi:hypothetical protein
MPQPRGADVGRGVLVVCWLVLAIRMKTVIGWPEIAAAAGLVFGTAVVWVWD